uniref:Phosphoglycerate mutase-like protein 4 n=1 Tax=Triticum urartu TaxID=4572 RepID=A0A8R7URR1_TRIUA
MSSSSTIEGKDGEFTEVVVVRHGETSWNASRIIQGHLDAELNEIGRQQAVAVLYGLLILLLPRFLNISLFRDSTTDYIRSKRISKKTYI